ncbi:hypothetical protein [Streptomyces griseofuscus]|uniref:hypothetical protein n=1 Tax=Streptomyces griseofuscus TaxID=146922 RepID=UPI0038112A71
MLARLGGQSQQQVEDLLDQLVRCRLFASWQHLREHDEIAWRLLTLRTEQRHTGKVITW